jgi:ribose-phosphate pyrophosphokinase
MAQLREPVRCKEVSLVRPTSPPANHHLVELPAMADACRRDEHHSDRPSFGYGRSDKQHGRREPITGGSEIRYR